MSTLEMVLWASLIAITTVAPLIALFTLAIEDERLPQADDFDEID